MRFFYENKISKKHSNIKNKKVKRLKTKFWLFLKF